MKEEMENGLLKQDESLNKTISLFPDLNFQQNGLKFPF